jgi:transcription antitermination factor NusG
LSEETGPWHVAKTRPAKEELARTNLDRQGVEAFLPRFWTTRRRGKAMADVLRPLFPGYIFFRCGADPAAWRSVSGTLGVSNILWGAGRVPQSVPQEFMSGLLEQCPGGVAHAIGSGPAVGSTVEVTRGPFVGLLGSVLSRPDAERVSVLLDVMGGVRVSLPASRVVAR